MATGYKTREMALEVSSRNTATPAAIELADGSFAACHDDTIDNDGRVSSWVTLPRRGLVRWADLQAEGVV
jgi:hypothetical protein